MIRDIRLATGACLLASSLALSPILQAIILALTWTLPFLVPEVFTPATESRRLVWMRFQPFAVVFLFVSVLIQGIFGPAPMLEVPLLPLSTDGMQFGLVTAMRAILLLSGVLLVLLPLSPLELASFLSRLKLPIGLPVALLLSLQVIEDLPKTIQLTRNAQRSRGLTFGGSLFARMRGLRNLITPVVMRTLEGSMERATALQLRGLTEPVHIVPRVLPWRGLAPYLYLLAVLLLIFWTLEWAGLLSLNI